MEYEFDPKALRRIRREKGVTQQQLAATVGCVSTFVCLIESGRRGPSFGTAASLAAALGVTVNDFVRPKT